MKFEDLPIGVKLTDKVVAITGAGGVICGALSKAIAAAGAKVAVLDLKLESAMKVVEEIRADGGIAYGYAANVLELESLKKAHDDINKDLGKVDILINGAGGNNPRANTDKEYYEAGDIDDPELKTFFNLDSSGVSFVFNLNFLQNDFKRKR